MVSRRWRLDGLGCVVGRDSHFEWRGVSFCTGESWNCRFDADELKCRYDVERMLTGG